MAPVCAGQGVLKRLWLRWGWRADDPLTYDEALTLYESMRVWVAWDGGDKVEMDRRGLMQADEVDWGTYVCGLTAP